MAPPLNHDALFKATFSRPELARAELEAILPKELLDQLDLTTLVLVPGSFVDEELRASLTDLLFTAKLAKGDEALLYILFEHLSQPEAFQALRLLRYEVSIWEAWRKEHPDAPHLPLILPVVVHHGPTGWKGSPGLRSLFGLSDDDLAPFRRFLPLFDFVLDDIGTLSLPDLTRRPMPPPALGTLLAFWSARQWERLLEAEPSIRDAVAHWPKDQGFEVLLHQLFFYLGSVASRHVEFLEVSTILLRMAGPEHKGVITTWGEQFFADGLERGRMEGFQEGIRRGIDRGLEQGLERGLEQGLERGLEQGLDALRGLLVETIRLKGFRLSEHHAQRIASCTDLATLTHWATRAAIASSEDAIFVD